MNLHNEIMNIQCDASAYANERSERIAYKTGHRDARHAAAELAIKEDRKDILLKAAYDLLMKQHKSRYVLNILSTTAVWDDVECDGGCLLEEIADLLGLEEPV